MKLSFLNSFILMLFLPFCSFGQGTLAITFDGPPAQFPGTGSYIQEYDESGVQFVPLSSAGFGRRNGSGSFGWPENGGTYLQATLGDSLRFGFLDGTRFNLSAVDLAGYSDVVPDFAVEFVGYRSVGGTVTATFSGTGINFRTFQFGPEFSDLIRVEIPTYGWSLDNLAVSVPEPTTWSMLLLGGGLLFRAQPRRKGKARAIPISNQNDHR